MKTIKRIVLPPSQLSQHWYRLATLAFVLALTLGGCRAPQPTTAPVAATGTPVPPPNLVQNPGFEDGMAPWQGSGQVVKSNAHNGEYAAQVDVEAGKILTQTVSGLKPNTLYTLNAWLLGNGSEVDMGVKDYGGEIVAFATSSDYVLHSILFTTGATNTSAVVYCWKPTRGMGYCDDFELKEGDNLPTPTPIWTTGPTITPETLATVASQSQADTLANTVIQAHLVSARSGNVSKQTGVAPDGDSIGSIAAGDWVEYSDINFGNGQNTLFMATVAAATSGNTIEIRLDSATGTRIGTLTVSATLGWSSFTEQYAAVSSVTGVHDLYLVFPQGNINLNWFIFSIDPDDETPAMRAARMQWWDNARFGQFIHFGAYAYLAHGEWAMFNENWSTTDYESQVASRFDPVDFDPVQWVTAMKNEGVKYIVITSKHHEGFSMWDTHVRDFDPLAQLPSTGLYDVADFTPYGKDVIAQLAQAARDQGIPFGLYYSILDWHHPSQAGFTHNSMVSEAWKAQYISEMKEQLRELIVNFDPAVLWFDGNWIRWWGQAESDALDRYLRVLKPDLIINNRLSAYGTNEAGDYYTPEQTIPSASLSREWETCLTMNSNWGYNAGDNNWKSTTSLIQALVDIASKNGNLLLNLGPKGDGTIPQESLDRMAQIGAWMDLYGDSIYGTTGDPFGLAPDWGRFTKKDGRLYAHVFTWPANGQLSVPLIQNTINKIYLMNDPATSLSYNITSNAIVISLPASQPDINDSVVVLDVVGMPACQGCTALPSP